MAKKNVPVNPFDAFSTPVAPVKKAAKKIAATFPEDKKKVVDTFIRKKAEVKSIEADLAQLGDFIIEVVGKQQEDQARLGNYSKSFTVQGTSAVLTYTTNDRFTTPKEPEVQVQLKALLKNRFDEFFMTKRTISLKEKLQSNTEFLQKFAGALTAAGINLGDTFDVVDVLEAKDGLDELQFKLSPRDLMVFKTLVKQYKPALK